MSRVELREVSEGEEGLRLDRWFRTHFPQLPHTRLEKLLRKGDVRLDGKRVKANARLVPGQTVRVPPLPPASEMPLRKTKNIMNSEDRAFIRSMVLFQDDDIIVLDKPAGLAVQGGSGTRRHIDGMLEALQGRASERPRLVHRLDKDTSGVLVIARSRISAARLGKLFQGRGADKLYWALVKGMPRPAMGIIDMPLIKAGEIGAEKIQPASGSGKHAVTQYAVVEHAADKAAFVMMKPLTGRTHQLRVHMAAIGHAIIGDGKYGGHEAFIGGLPERLHLHAASITLPGKSGKPRTFSAGPPAHMLEGFEALGFDPNPDSNPFDED